MKLTDGRAKLIGIKLRRYMARGLARLCGASLIAWAAGCSPKDAGNNTTTARALWHIAGAASQGGPPAFDGATAFFLNNAHKVIAVDGQSGVQRWTAPTGTVGGGTYGEAGCVAAGAVVACGDDDVIAFNRADGSLAWRYHAAIGYSPGYFSPAVVATTIYAGSPSGTIYAIDATTGASRWTTRPFPADSELISIFDPSADNDIVVAGFTKFLQSPTEPIGGVVALDAATGQIRWIAYFPQPSPAFVTNGRSTALWQNVVLAPSAVGGTVYEFDRGTGAIQSTLPGVGLYPPQFNSYPATQDLRAITVYGSTLYAISGSCWLVAYDLVHGTELYRVASPVGAATAERVFSDGQTVYGLYLGGAIVAYSATTPFVRWTAGTLAVPFNTPVVIGTDRVFAAGAAGFYALSK